MDKNSKEEIFLIVGRRSKKERIFYLNRQAKFRSLRKNLKKNLGMAIFQGTNESMDHVKEIITLLNAKKIIAIGDFITKTLIEAGIKLNLAIFDKFVENKNFGIDFDLSSFKEVIEVDNPRGVITKKAYSKVKEALKRESVAIIVNGEEDLLALVAILESEDDSLVVFGIPKFGVELVKVNKRKKFILRKLIQRMF